MRSAAGGTLGRPYFGDHAAGADVCATAASHTFVTLVAGRALADQGGAGVFARVGGVETLLIGQDNQGVGFNEVGDQRAQRVIVTKTDLVRGAGVIVVDDRQDAQIEQ